MQKKRPLLKRYTATQLRTLLTVACQHPLEALFTLAIATGMRRGELLGLTWQDIDLDLGQIQVRSTLTHWKNDVSRERCLHPRCVVLAPFALETLRQHARASRDLTGHAFVFCSSSGAPLLAPDEVLVPFALLLERAGLPTLTFHGLRASVLHLLLQLQAPPMLIQDMLGFQFCSATTPDQSAANLEKQKKVFKALQDVLIGKEESEGGDGWKNDD